MQEKGLCKDFKLGMMLFCLRQNKKIYVVGMEEQGGIEWKDEEVERERERESVGVYGIVYVEFVGL